MARLQVLIIAITFLSVALAKDEQENLDVTNDGPKPIRDRFRLVMSNADKQKLDDEINYFLAYGCEKLAVVKNQAQDSFKIACKSHHEAPKPAVIKPGESYAFSFRPQKTGNSVFWCTIEYNQQFARFDVYNEELSYMCPRDIHEVYQYIVHHDGVYVVKKGDHGQKIRALSKGHNKFLLWEEFAHNETDGYLASGLVDGGMCYDVPEQFNDKAAAVTVCYNHCVHLYEHYGCQGKVQTVQATDECVDEKLSDELLGKMSSVQGC